MRLAALSTIPSDATCPTGMLLVESAQIPGWKCIEPEIVDVDFSVVDCPAKTHFNEDASVAAGQVICSPNSEIPSWLWLVAGGILFAGAFMGGRR